jgi:hypothetical protein
MLCNIIFTTGTGIDDDIGSLLEGREKGVVQETASTLYPGQSLQCFSSLTKPDMQLICPAARSTWCVKEVSSMKQDQCGQTQYFGDLFIDSMCVFKKCAADCVEGTFNFKYGPTEYTRQRFCCNTNYCNSSSPKYMNATSLLIVCILSLLGLFLL